MKKMLAQLMRQNGGCKVTIAAPGGLKMDLAKSLEAGDHYVELSRSQFNQLKQDNPHGFDIGTLHPCTFSRGRLIDPTMQSSRLPAQSRSLRMLSTTSAVAVSSSSMGKSDLICIRLLLLTLISVYANADRVSWPPSKIFGDEITILGSFSETYMFRKFLSTEVFLLRNECGLTPLQRPRLTILTLARSRPRVSSIRHSSWSSTARL